MGHMHRFNWLDYSSSKHPKPQSNTGVGLLLVFSSPRIGLPFEKLTRCGSFSAKKTYTHLGPFLVRILPHPHQSMALPWAAFRPGPGLAIHDDGAPQLGRGPLALVGYHLSGR